MKSHECPSCHGTRTYTRMVPEVKYGISHPNGWTGAPVKVAYETGRMVARNFPCAVCHGSGRVDCEACGDTGYVEEGTTEPEGLYPCDCAAGQREMAGADDYRKRLEAEHLDDAIAVYDAATAANDRAAKV